MQKKNIHKSLVHCCKLSLIPIIILCFLSTIALPQNENKNEDYKIRTVVIDPGHGGKDPGALGAFSKEKDIVLAIGLLLGQYIEEKIPEAHVIYTRKTDEFIPLYRRAEIANEADADIFISIHANGWSNPKSFGTETLILGLHRSDENFEVAKRENSVILLEEDYTTRYENFDPNSPASYIIFSIMQNVYDKQSISFADMVQSQFRERVKRKDRGVRRQGLLVLAQSSMPGVLIETGFITNPEEEKYLNSGEGQDYIASAIFRAFRSYKEDIELKSGVSFASSSLAGIENDSDSVQISINSDTTVFNPRLYFKVQITSSSNEIPLSSDFFADFKNVEEFKSNNSYKYAVGTKLKYDDIVEYSERVKNKYPDAFIIAVKNGEIISIQEALHELYNKQN